MNEMSVLEIIKTIIKRKWIVIISLILISALSLLNIRTLINGPSRASATVAFSLPDLVSQAARSKEFTSTNIINSANADAYPIGVSKSIALVPLFSVSGDINQDYINNLLESSAFSNYLYKVHIFETGDKLTVNILGSTSSVAISSLKTDNMEILANKVLSAMPIFIESRIKARLQEIRKYATACIAEDSTQIAGVTSEQYKALSIEKKQEYNIYSARVEGYKALNAECSSLITNANIRPELFIKNYVIDSDSLKIKIAIFALIGIIFGLVVGGVLAIVVEYISNIKNQYKHSTPRS